MKKTVKLLSLFLAVILAVIPLCGCSSAELGYLDAAFKPIFDGGIFTGSEKMTIDMNSMLETALWEELFAGVIPAEELPDAIEIVADVKADFSELVCECDYDISLGTLASLGFKYIVEGDTLYFGDFKYKLDERIEKALAESFELTEEAFVAQNLLSVFKDIEYISFSMEDYENLMTLLMGMTGEMPEDDTELAEMEFVVELSSFLMENTLDYSKITLDFVKNLFAGYSTGLVSETETGYKIEADEGDLLQLLESFADYMTSNYDVLIDASTKLYEDIAELAKKEGKDELAAFIDQMLVAFEDAVIEADAASAALGAEPVDLFTPEQLEEAKRILKGTKFVSTLDIKDGGYVTSEKLDLIMQDIILATVESVSDITPAESIALTDLSGKNVVGVSELVMNAYAAATYAEYSTIEEMRITWNGTDGTAPVYGTLYMDESENEYALGLYDFHNIDGSMYLPMRRICERFGETVDWDAVNGKAYVVRGEEKIDMTGRIIGDRTFIKIRDFEKLGYFVDYKVDEAGKPWAILNCKDVLDEKLVALYGDVEAIG